jgi:hypothetical protein
MAMIGADSHQSYRFLADARRERIRRRVERLKRVVVAGAVIAFGTIWALVAHHTVGVTASSGAPSRVSHPNSASSPSQSSGSNGFFGSGDDTGAVGSGNGSGSGPVLNSGGS